MAATNPFRLSLLLLTLGAAAFAESAVTESAPPPHSLTTEVQIMKRSAAPTVREHWVVFSYRPTASARFVAARFEHESYAVLHPFMLNEQKLYVLVYRPPKGLAELTYRISVDGLWMRDPANPRYTTDSFGTEYSVVGLEDLEPSPARDPVVSGDGRVTFTYRGTPGRIVTVAGSFNQWDPYVHVLRETAEGVYSLTLRLPPGSHYYTLLENGRKRLDPANEEARRDSEGQLVSYFQIP